MDKQTFRAKSLKRLKKASKQVHFGIDKKISNSLRMIIKKTRPRSILFYMPLAMEVDIKGVIRYFRRSGLDIFIPYIEDESFKMVKYRLPLEIDRLGTLRPKTNGIAYKKVDLIIAPVIAVDGVMRRIGFGKGMYDRFVEKLENKPDIIFIQRIGCKDKTILTNSRDISCDVYIHSKEITIKRRKYDGNTIYSFGNACRVCNSSFCLQKWTKFKKPNTRRTGKSKSKSYRT